MRFKKFALLLVFAILPVVVYNVKAKNNTIYDPVPLDKIHPIKDDSRPALIGLAAIYSPTESKADWLNMVCSGMTEGGCNYFKDNQAAQIWENEAGNIGSTTGFIANVKTINESAQVWKVQLTVFKPGHEEASDVYALVSRNEDGVWYLNRILSGPRITPP